MVPPNEQTYKEGETYIGSDTIVSTGCDTKGFLTGYDMSTGRIAWQKEFPESCYSGAVTTSAGGLVFVGQNNGEALGGSGSVETAYTEALAKSVTVIGDMSNAARNENVDAVRELSDELIEFHLGELAEAAELTACSEGGQLVRRLS